jgi:hypothetical protein
MSEPYKLSVGQKRASFLHVAILSDIGGKVQCIRTLRRGGLGRRLSVDMDEVRVTANVDRRRFQAREPLRPFLFGRDSQSLSSLSCVVFLDTHGETSPGRRSKEDRPTRRHRGGRPWI